VSVVRDLAFARLRDRTEKLHARACVAVMREGPASPLEAEICANVEELADILWKVIELAEKAEKR
jgi:hypothetical protein